MNVVWRSVTLNRGPLYTSYELHMQTRKPEEILKSIVRTTCVSLAGLALWIGVSATVFAQNTPSQNRGQLLYETHCTACHNAQIHWRDKKLATNWPSLQAQVRRWQGNTGLYWEDADIGAVAEYLNDRYYGYPVARQNVRAAR